MCKTIFYALLFFGKAVTIGIIEVLCFWVSPVGALAFGALSLIRLPTHTCLINLMTPIRTLIGRDVTNGGGEGGGGAGKGRRGGGGVGGGVGRGGVAVSYLSV